MWRLSDTPGRVRFSGRAVGADTEVLVRELGLDDDAVADLRARRPGMTSIPRRRRRTDDDQPTRTDPFLDAVAGGVEVYDLGRPLTVGMPQSPNHPPSGTRCRAATATWCGPTAARRPTT